jgi:hypothetical protein
VKASRAAVTISRTAVFALESYDRVGVVLRPSTEVPFSLFVPWSAVIELSRADSEGA